jgi:hypothetical protein
MNAVKINTPEITIMEIPLQVKLLEEAIDDLNSVVRERDEAREAIKNYYEAKGRYNSQIAAAKMFEIAGLPALYPANYLKKEAAK